MTSQEFIFSNDENKLSEKPQTKLLKSKIILKQKQSLLILIDQAFLNNHEAATGGECQIIYESKYAFSDGRNRIMNQKSRNISRYKSQQNAILMLS